MGEAITARARVTPGERATEGQPVRATGVRREPPKEARREQGTEEPAEQGMEEQRERAKEEPPDRRPEVPVATPAAVRLPRLQ